MADELTTGRTIAADFPQQLVNRVETGGIRFIDVRTPAEWKISRIEGAEHLPLPDILENHFPEAGKMESLVLQCGSGYRSDIAASVLRQKGYTNATPLAGGGCSLGPTRGILWLPTNLDAGYLNTTNSPSILTFY
jgi:rhodanese-related sulfurtransferase